MNSLGHLKRWLQRHHCAMGASCAILALVTYFLEYNYVVQKRDLICWLNYLMLLSSKPSQLLLFTMSIILPLLTLVCKLCQLILKLQKFCLKQLCKYHEHKYGDFIVRRLLLQLERAMLRMPAIIDMQQLEDQHIRRRYQLAKAEAYRAVDIFRRDASALLTQPYLQSSGESPIYVLQEEELLLVAGGYSQIGLYVTNQVLRHLLNPQGEHF